MGLTNHGIQSITYQYFLEATGINFGRRLLGILPCGIYSGGYLTRVSDSEITLSPLIAEIKDTTNQISVRTASLATLNSTTLDSGTISSATPYIVLRWAYAISSVNYVEVHALASVATALTNDIVVGKCLFSGSVLTDFSYSERTFLNVQDLFLKVETSTGLYVQLRAGRMHTATGYVLVPEQRIGPFVVPNSPNSRIDLVYVNTTGTVGILQGTQAVSPVVPSYVGKLVVAQVTLVNGDSTIPASRIIDVRSFIAPADFPDGVTIEKHAITGKLQTISQFFPTAVISTTKSITLPNGLIIKWGTDAASASDSSYTKTVTFPAPFPFECWGVWPVARAIEGSANGCFINSKTKSNFVINNRDYGPATWWAIGY